MWGALHKAWKDYIIAKNKDEIDRLYYYAEVIQKLQRELGLPVSLFPSLGLSPQELADDASEELSFRRIRWSHAERAK